MQNTEQTSRQNRLIFMGNEKMPCNDRNHRDELSHWKSRIDWVNDGNKDQEEKTKFQLEEELSQVRVNLDGCKEEVEGSVSMSEIAKGNVIRMCREIRKLLEEKDDQRDDKSILALVFQIKYSVDSYLNEDWPSEGGRYNEETVYRAGVESFLNLHAKIKEHLSSDIKKITKRLEEIVRAKNLAEVEKSEDTIQSEEAIAKFNKLLKLPVR